MLSAKNLKITFNPGTPIETRALRGLSLDIPGRSPHCNRKRRGTGRGSRRRDGGGRRTAYPAHFP